MEIMVLKLKSGEYLISMVTQKSNKVNLIYPVEFYIDFGKDDMDQELVMNYWLPINMIEEQATNILSSDIAFIATPKKEFKEFYLNFINQNDDIDNISKSLISSMLEEKDKIDISKYH